MKKFILNSLVIAVALSGAVTAFAEETSNTSVRPNPLKALMEAQKNTREETREKMQDVRENRASTTKAIKDDAKERMLDLKAKMASSSTERKEDREEKMEERREDRIELIKRMIGDRFRKMFMRFQATIDRETKIMTKINTRIEKVKTAGGNTTNAEKFTAEAKVHLGEAQTALDMLKVMATSTAEIDAQLLATTTSPGTVTKGTLQKMKGVTEQIEKHLKEAHKALENALKNLRGMSSVNANATTTTPANTGTSTTATTTNN
ncbi:MAG: hypothetical protein CEO12_547 [Parcubacteria group bacterium Gr01-1014_46]|nr:MAG: hypothetical protein CEO12_547 [Parcubacteria group bacterium Gr01-1014_46]